MAKMNWLNDQMAAFYFNHGPAPTPPATYWLALSNSYLDQSAVDSASMSEVADGLGYARVEVPADAAHLLIGANGDTASALHSTTEFVFPPPTADWGLIRSIYLCDAASGGMPWFGSYSSEQNVLVGYTVRVPASGIYYFES